MAKLKSYADVAAVIQGKIAKFKDKLAKTSDPISTTSIKKMVGKLEGKLDELFQEQEQVATAKGLRGNPQEQGMPMQGGMGQEMPMGRYGGKIPMYQTGGGTPYAEGYNPNPLFNDQGQSWGYIDTIPSIQQPLNEYSNLNKIPVQYGKTPTFTPSMGTNTAQRYNSGEGAFMSRLPNQDVPIDQNAPGYQEATLQNSLYGPPHETPSSGIPDNNYAMDYLPGAIAGGVSGLYDIGMGINSLRNPDKFDFGRIDKVNPSLINMEGTKARGTRAIEEERAAANYNIRGGASSAGQYLSSRTALGVGAGKAKADFLNKIGEFEANTNAGIINQNNQFNSGIDSQNLDLKYKAKLLELQGKARSQESISRGIGQLGTVAGQYGSNVAKSKQQDELFSSLGTNDFEYVYTIDPRDGKKKRMLVPKTA